MRMQYDDPHHRHERQDQHEIWMTVQVTTCKGGDILHRSHYRSHGLFSSDTERHRFSTLGDLDPLLVQHIPVSIANLRPRTKNKLDVFSSFSPIIHCHDHFLTNDQPTNGTSAASARMSGDCDTVNNVTLCQH